MKSKETLVACLLLLIPLSSDMCCVSASPSSPGTASTLRSLKTTTPTTNCSTQMWDSSDCQLNALCVPIDHDCSYHNRNNHKSSSRQCSCTFTNIFKLLPNGNCGPTSSAKVFASFWLLDAAVAFVFGIHFVQSFWISFQKHVFKTDMLALSSCCGMLTAFTHTAHRTLVAVIILDTTNNKQIRTAMLVVTTIWSGLMLVCPIVFGVAVHLIVLQSQSLKQIDSKDMKRKVLFTAGVLGTLIMVGAIVMFSSNRIVAGYLYFCGFALLTFMLHRHILKHFAELAAETFPQSQQRSASAVAEKPSTSNTFSASVTTTSTNVVVVAKKHSNTHSSQQQQQPPTTANNAAHQILDEMNVLTKKIMFIASTFICASGLYGVMWYAGGATCNADMIGPAAEAFHFVMYSVLTLGLVPFATFSRRLVHIRMSKHEITLPNTKPKVSGSV